MKRYFAGIGSRKTPDSEIWKFEEITNLTNKHGYILNSGGASGADDFFEVFCNSGQIFLPWNGFNGRRIHQNRTNFDYIVPDEKLDWVKRFHPKFDNLSPSAKKLMSRNTYQVLGVDLKTPVDFVVCWTPSGKDEGGTAQACRIARFFKIPVYNMNNEKEFTDLKEFLHRVKFW